MSAMCADLHVCIRKFEIKKTILIELKICLCKTTAVKVKQNGTELFFEISAFNIFPTFERFRDWKLKIADRGERFLRLLNGFEDLFF